MWRRDRLVSRSGHRLTGMLLASAAVVAILAPGIGGAESVGDDDTALVAEAKRVKLAAVTAYNEKKWDELRALYLEDAVAIAPNQEPIHGRGAIVDHFGFGDAYGTGECRPAAPGGPRGC